MKKLRVTVVDLVVKGKARKLFGKLMNANLSTIMPQVVAVWCEQLGHDVRFICYTGTGNLTRELLEETDVVFLSAYSRSAQLAYALSGLLRSRGVVTVLGGPHARCYPEDSAKYFDYVLGFTDKELIDDVLREREPHRPGRILNATGQPPVLPGARERWKYIEATIAKTPFMKAIPMIGSTGCPYQCSFCIDARVDYQPMPYDVLQEDLRFIRTKVRNPKVVWHDPLFGVRFKETMAMIEEAVPPGSMDFIAEISLSLLSEPNVKRLAQVGFQGLLPGIESWYDFGNKAKTRRNAGEEKLRQVAEHINMLLSYVPFVQANFVAGLDCDEGPEPFELTKRFVDMTPGAWPAISILTAYGEAAPLNLELQREGRLVPVPFHFLDNKHMNVRPKNYDWAEFYTLSSDLKRHAFTGARIRRRFAANRGFHTKAFNALRVVSRGRIKREEKIAHMLRTDAQFRRFFDQETSEIPPYFSNIIRRDLGELWNYLPADGLIHDPNAYRAKAQLQVQLAAGAA